MNDTTRIGIAIVQHAKHVLVGVRSNNQVLAGKAEFPGGKCEPAESAQACAVRECLEETGIQVEVSHLLHRIEHQYDHGCVDLHFFICQPVEIEPNEMPAVTNGFCWIPQNELAELNFPEANREVVNLLLNT